MARAKSTIAPYSVPTSAPEGITIHVALASALLSFASEDPTRPILDGIGVTCDPEGRMWVASSDGHTLARALVACPGRAEVVGHWPRAYVERALAVAKIEGQSTVLLASDARDPGAFPPAHQVVPAPCVNAQALACLQPAYLKRAGDVATALSKSAGHKTATTVAIRTLTGKLDPVRLDVVHGSDEVTLLEIVIMPMRHGEKLANGGKADDSLLERAESERDRAESDRDKARQSADYWQGEAIKAKNEIAEMRATEAPRPDFGPLRDGLSSLASELREIQALLSPAA